MRFVKLLLLMTLSLSALSQTTDKKKSSEGQLDKDDKPKTAKESDKPKDTKNIDALKIFLGVIEDLEKLPGIKKILQDLPRDKIKKIQGAAESIAKEINTLKKFHRVQSLDAIPDVLLKLENIPELGFLKDLTSKKEASEQQVDEEDKSIADEIDKSPTLDKNPQKKLDEDLKSASKLKKNLEDFENFKDQKSKNAVKSDKLKDVEADVENIEKDVGKLINFKGVESLKAVPAIIEDLEKLPGMKKFLKDLPLDKIKELEGAAENIAKDINTLKNFHGVQSLDAIPDVLENLEKIPGLGFLKDLPVGEILKDVKEYAKKKETVKFHWELGSKLGWGFTVNIGLIADWDVNSLVSGIPDGSYLKLGSRIGLVGTFVQGDHEWRNKFTLSETFSFTPSIPVFVKSRDYLAFETSYLYSIGTWFGAFGHFAMDTAIFRGVDIQSVLVTYNITDDANEIKRIPDVNHLKLTTPFSPLYLKEIIGAFVRPFRLPAFTWEIKAGGYALQVFADRQRKVVGKNANGDINIKTLHSFIQLGPSVGTHFFGIAFSEILAYKVGVDVGYSAINTSSRVATRAESLNLDAEVSITLRPFPWIGVTWDGRVNYLTDVDKGFQIDNKVMFDFPFDF